MTKATDECRDLHMKKIADATADQLTRPHEIPKKLRAALVPYDHRTVIQAAADRIEELEAALADCRKPAPLAAMGLSGKYLPLESNGCLRLPVREALLLRLDDLMGLLCEIKHAGDATPETLKWARKVLGGEGG